MKIWLIILLGGILTYLTRLSFIALFGRMKIPALGLRALRFIPPAVLCAIIFPELLVQSGQVSLSIANPRLLAGVVAALIAWRTRSALLTILVGMGTLLALQAML